MEIYYFAYSYIDIPVSVPFVYVLLTAIFGENRPWVYADKRAILHNFSTTLVAALCIESI